MVVNIFDMHFIVLGGCEISAYCVALMKHSFQFLFLHAARLCVVNDLAERGVSLIPTFNSSLARDEEQKQYQRQIV